MTYTYAVRLNGNRVPRLTTNSVSSFFAHGITTAYITGKDEASVREKLARWYLDSHVYEIKRLG